jgi:hypothetical protein
MCISVPPAAIGGANPTGWSNEEPFIDYLKHFTSYQCLVRKTQLILDNHDSHLSIPAINKAKEKGIVFLSLLPCTSLKLQPLDYKAFGPYTTRYNTCLNDSMLSYQGKILTIYSVAGTTIKSFSKSFTKHNTEKGFM